MLRPRLYDLRVGIDIGIGRWFMMLDVNTIKDSMETLGKYQVLILYGLISYQMLQSGMIFMIHISIGKFKRLKIRAKTILCLMELVYDQLRGKGMMVKQLSQ